MENQYQEDRRKLQELHKQRQIDAGVPSDKIKPLVEEDIDESIASNSTPLKHRIGTRILAPLVGEVDLDDTVVTLEDAKGMAAFRPRLADNYVEDRVVHGLYQMYRGVQETRENLGSIGNIAQQVMQEKPTNESLLRMNESYATQYDPDQLPFIPETDSSLVSNMVGAQSTIRNKTLALKFTLEDFAIKNGFNDLVKTKQYARLYQIYRIHNETKKLFRLIQASNKSTTELQFLYRHYVLQLWNLTKAQRDANNSERNILDFSKSIGIDPSMFRDKEGNNLRWIDTLITLGNLGISETQTLSFGISPTQLVLLGTDKGKIQQSTIKESGTTTEPSIVQGRDVSDLICKVFADDVVKREATLYCENLVKQGKLPSITYDATGKYVLLSSVPTQYQEEILKNVLSNEDLLATAIDNLNLYAEVSVYGKDKRVQFFNSKEHPLKPGTFVVNRPGIGDISVSRTVQGQKDLRFILTTEDIKRMLVSVRNSSLLTRIEVAQQTNKSIGGDTMQGLLKDEGYNEFLERRLQQLSEETEMLGQLQPDLILSQTDRMRDDLGLEMNLYHAEHYYAETINGLTPFKATMLVPITNAIEKGKLYPSLNKEVDFLQKFMDSFDIPMTDRIAIGFAIHLMQNSPELDHDQKITLISEFIGGIDLKEKIEKDILPMAAKLQDTLDKINFSSFKGKNIYRGFAIKIFEENGGISIATCASNPQILRKFYNTYDPVTGDIIFKDPNKLKQEMAKFIQALTEVEKTMKSKEVTPSVFPDLLSEDIINMGLDPSLFEANIENGLQLNTQIQSLVTSGIISEQVATFYRTMVANILRRNPELGQFLSISTEDLGDGRFGSAIKNGDRFQLKLNSRLMKTLGTVDQVRVFAHEISHIMRLAYIKDNSNEWRQIEGLLRSKKGRQTIETMLLVINNNKKYDGFDKDVEYFVSHPEEFAAQWGSWLLTVNTLGSTELSTILQKRNKGAFEIQLAWSKAMHRMESEVHSILAGMDNIDIDVLTQITEMTENMFGFNSTEKRTIHFTNANQDLALIKNIDNLPLDESQRERLIELQDLYDNPITNATMSIAEKAERHELRVLHSRGRIHTNSVTLRAIDETRKARENAQNHADYVATPFDQLDIASKQELAITFVEQSIHECSKIASANSTLGGLARNTAEKIPLFGKRLTNYILSGRDTLLNMGQTGSAFTFGSSNSIISALMYIIGDTLSVHQGQYLMDTGSNGIRENRTYSKMFVERIANEANNLRLICNNDEYVALQKWALSKSLGNSNPLPTGLNPEQIKQVNILADTIKTNMIQMKKLIHSGAAVYYEDAAVGWDIGQIGVVSDYTSSEKRTFVKTNRKTIITNLKTLIKDNIIGNRRCSSEVLYITGVMPRTNNKYRPGDDGRDTDFIAELIRLRNRITGDANSVLMLKKVSVEILVKRGIVRGEAVRALDQIFASGANFTLSSPTMTDVTLRALHEATLQIYSAFQNQSTMDAAFKKLDITDNNIKDGFEKAIIAELTSSQVNSSVSRLFSDEPDNSLPPGIFSGKKQSSFMSDETDGTNLSLIAMSVLHRMGEKANFMYKNGLVTGQDLLNDLQLSKFISHRNHTNINDIERTQGFNAIGRRSIENVTGIKGYSLSELIKALEASASILVMDDDERRDFTKSLEIIKQKLKIEQNMRDIGDSTDSEFMSKMMLRYGPEITQMVFGPNLNTASLLNEGLVGAVVSNLYGGSATRFMIDALGGVVKDWFKNLLLPGTSKLQQKGYARNTLLGLERASHESKSLGHIADYQFDDNLSKWEKFKSWRRQLNSTMYRRLNDSLTNQAQIILVKSLNNGDLAKLKGIFNRDDVSAPGIDPALPMQNQDHLSRDIKKAKVKGINAHYAYILKQAGLLEGNRLEIYSWMLANIPSKEIRNGTLDFQAALRWIETFDWSSLHGLNFTREEAYQTIKALYDTTKGFRDIAMVESNPWDSNTHSGSLRILAAVYRQYPNIWVNQHLIRRGALMSTPHYLIAQLSQFIGELMYNLLLATASGLLSFSDWKFWEEESKLSENPLIITNLIVSRNPIFGLMVNTVSQVAHQVLMQMQRSKERHPNGPMNEIKETQQMTNDVITGLLASGSVPATAAGILARSAMTFYQATTTEGNMNEQETYDVKMAVLSFMNALIPGFGELIFKLGQRAVMGSRPEYQPIRPMGEGAFKQKDKPLLPQVQAPQVPQETQPKDFEIPRKAPATNPIPIPKNLLESQPIKVPK